jgi:Zn finger protein HypA/HybF involved in hydrogenase expression
MTEVVEFLCKTCKKKFGPLGLHGAHVELVGICRKCRDFRILNASQGKPQLTACPKCSDRVELFEGICPNCGSTDMYYRDLAIQIPGEEGWMKYKK